MQENIPGFLSSTFGDGSGIESLSQESFGSGIESLSQESFGSGVESSSQGSFGSGIESSSQESVSSGVSKQRSSPRSWSWVFQNKWAERTQTKRGLGIRCLFPGCNQIYQTVTMTTSGINTHLKKAHRITSESGVNDGARSRATGPLDALFNFSKQPKVFDRKTFEDLLVRFVVTTKQPFAIVKSTAFQELLDLVVMASTNSQVKLPSEVTLADKVYIVSL
jgi:hypothetical protein